MDFLDQARRWAAEAAGLQHTSPQPSPQKPDIRNSPRMPSPTLVAPRSLGDAVARALDAEARNLALQTALDRYTAQSEIMEVSFNLL